MKRIALVSIALVLLLASCATMAEPTVVGKWSYTDEYGDTVVYYFTADGKYAKIDGEWSEFGDYEDDGSSLMLDGDSHFYVLEGRTMTMDGYEMKRKSAKAVSDCAHIRGVWEYEDDSDYIQIGFTGEGDVVCMGSYCNRGSYSVDAEEGELTVKNRTSDYLIINDILLVDGLSFSDLSGVAVFERKTSGGANQSRSYLTSGDGWFYQQSGTSSLTGTQYLFYSSGSFHAWNISNGGVTSEYSGTYTFEYPYVVDLGSNGSLTFCVVDGIAFGYN